MSIEPPHPEVFENLTPEQKQTFAEMKKVIQAAIEEQRTEYKKNEATPGVPEGLLHAARDPLHHKARTPEELAQLKAEGEAIRATIQKDLDDLAAERYEKVRRQVSEWTAQGEWMKKIYPSFDFRAELQNKEFLDLLKKGLSVQQAYELIHRTAPPAANHKKKPRTPLLTALLVILGIVVGIIVWGVAGILVRLVVSLLGSIPIIGNILYYPSDASWALLVLPPASGVFAGVFCSSKICGSSKPFSALICSIYVLDIVYMIFTQSFAWSNFIVAVVSIVSAALMFRTPSDK